MPPNRWRASVLAIGIIASLAVACQRRPEATTVDGAEEALTPRTFQDDLAFLERHMEVIVLGDPNAAGRVVVSPRWQGRVMTSTANAAGGIGYGWINETLIESGALQPHINAIGGEDRFWLGPEGGQFSIFFAGDDPFDLDHWQTPPSIDSEPYRVVDQDERHVTLTHNAALTNYSGTRFDVRIDRTIRLVDMDDFDVAVPSGVRSLVYESENTITNTGDQAWNAETGLLSIWILGMFKHSPDTTVVIPFQPGPEDTLGPVVNDAYFGKVPDNRLAVEEDVLFFRADGAYRSKIGLSPQRARPTLGSYDAGRRLLTLVRYDLPAGATDYVNSMWEVQTEPYAGDAVNSYNDGPPAPGAPPLGPFYELETSSPAAALTPNASLTHAHRTYHFEGDPADLDDIARTALGVGLSAIDAALR